MTTYRIKLSDKTYALVPDPSGDLIHKNELEEVIQNIEVTEKRIAELEKENQELVQELQNSRKANSEKLKKLQETYQEKVNSLEQNLNKDDSQLKTFEEERKGLLETIETLKASNKELSSKAENNQALTKEVSSLKKKIDSSTKEIAELNSKNFSLNEELEKFSKIEPKEEIVFSDEIDKKFSDFLNQESENRKVKIADILANMKKLAKIRTVTYDEAFLKLFSEKVSEALLYEFVEKAKK